MSSSSDTIPLVSVVIPTYHWSSALRLAIRSVQLQTLHNFEILVVGDGCTDDTEQVVASLQDDRIRWFNLDRNHGSQWAANNLAIENARADWIAYLGHDDIWYPTHLEAITRTARAESADVVTSLLAIYGPPGSGVRGIAGLFPSGTYSSKDFVPPSAFAHARGLYDGLIKWRDPGTLALPMDAHFLGEITQSARKFASTRKLTSFKFNAAYRRDSYKLKSVDEQRNMLDRIEGGADFLQAELIDILQSSVSGTFVNYRLSPTEGIEPGSVVRQNRKLKGIEPRFDPAELKAVTEPMRFDLSGPVMPFEWHELASHPIHHSFRWSGPSPTATIDIPIRFDRDMLIRVKILSAMAAHERIDMLIHGQRLDSRSRIEHDGTITIEAETFVSRHAQRDRDFGITIAIGKTVRPCDISDSADTRFLGVAVIRVEIEPLSQIAPRWRAAKARFNL